MSEDLQKLRPDDGLTFEFDAATRLMTMIEQEQFAIQAKRIAVPFALVKEAAAQILEFEAQMTIAGLAMGTKPKDYPPGVRGKLRCAEILMLEAKGEQAAAAVTEGSDSRPEADAEAKRIKANLGLIV